MEKHHLESKEAMQKLKELVEDVKVCMLATVQQDYSVYSRPMHTVEVDEAGNIWFFTNEFSEKVDDILKDNTVYLMYAHPGDNTYLHVKGTGSIVNDKNKIKEKWSPMVKAFFPKGEDDPALTLLKVNPSEASYCDGSSSKFVEFLNVAKALATGKKYDEGEFGKLEVK
jgi:general stress protein 26